MYFWLGSIKAEHISSF